MNQIPNIDEIDKDVPINEIEASTSDEPSSPNDQDFLGNIQFSLQEKNEVDDWVKEHL